MKNEYSIYFNMNGHCILRFFSSIDIHKIKKIMWDFSTNFQEVLCPVKKAVVNIEACKAKWFNCDKTLISFLFVIYNT